MFLSQQLTCKNRQKKQTNNTRAQGQTTDNIFFALMK